MGGKDYKDAARRILAKIFTHEMALQLSWSETKGKVSIKSFKNLLLFINGMFAIVKCYVFLSACVLI